ncbi:hypothetical protein [Nocardia lijiangensis]|uniref:hypothetical protein n=1 Tax=Nocardia lijiangensis TaxID=299618 RepID=UPI003D738302
MNLLLRSAAFVDGVGDSKGDDLGGVAEQLGATGMSIGGPGTARFLRHVHCALEPRTAHE